jgi:nucleotidyltransferase/DNA polymerase involved in DNA repair
MSARVMSCLEELAPRVEQYSIDEMFLDLTGVEHCMALEDFGRQLRQHVYDCTRLTIGVGTAHENPCKISTMGLKGVETVSWCARPDSG